MLNILKSLSEQILKNETYYSELIYALVSIHQCLENVRLSVKSCARDEKIWRVLPPNIQI